MGLSRLGCGGFALLAAFLLVNSCLGPTYNPGVLKAIRAESELLMAKHPLEPPKRWAEIPKSEWPPSIASLQPEIVTVHEWGVHIWIKPFFDGGWGYEIPRDPKVKPMPEGCYSEPGPGVFWHDPC
jgi:hypothetical protein